MSAHNKSLHRTAIPLRSIAAAELVVRDFILRVSNDY